MALVVLVTATATATERVPPRPPRPSPRPAPCERWSGPGQGNDPSFRFDLVLCRDGDAVTGTMRTSSARAGESVRGVAGRWRGAALELHDTRWITRSAGAGWRFCRVLRYSLTQTAPAALSGSYVAECDTGSLELARQR